MRLSKVAGLLSNKNLWYIIYFIIPVSHIISASLCRSKEKKCRSVCHHCSHLCLHLSLHLHPDWRVWLPHLLCEGDRVHCLGHSEELLSSRHNGGCGQGADGCDHGHILPHSHLLWQVRGWSTYVVRIVK